jgi:predicted kinase
VTTILRYPKVGQTSMIIMRGLPGAGKTYTALTISNYADDHCEVVRVSADDYFYGEDGVYRFDLSKLPQAHGECFRKAVSWATNPRLPTRSRLILVDNTNISAWEVAPYMALAQAYAIPAYILTVDCGQAECMKRNSERSPDRKVPEVVLANMAMRFFEEKLPPWWDNVITKSF